jgi:hypothetical protein
VSREDDVASLASGGPPEQLLIAEYTALRAEILQAQQTRGVVLALAFTTLGVTATLGSHELAGHKGVAATAVALSTFSLLVASAAVHFTAILTLRIDLIATYIRQFIEGPYGGLWETRWKEALSRSAVKSTWLGPPLATSRGYAVYYALLALGGAGEFWVTGGNSQPWLFVIPLTPFSIAILLCHNLYTKRRAGWPDPMSAQRRDDAIA